MSNELTEDELRNRLQSLIKVKKVIDVQPGTPCVYKGVPIVKLYVDSTLNENSGGTTENTSHELEGKWPFMALMSDHKIKPQLSALISNIIWLKNEEEVEIPPMVIRSKADMSEEDAIRRALGLPKDFDLSKLPKQASRNTVIVEDIIGPEVKKEITEKLEAIQAKMAAREFDRPTKRVISWAFQGCGVDPSEVIKQTLSFIKLAYAHSINPEKAPVTKIHIGETRSLHKLGAILILGCLVNREIIMKFMPHVFEGEWNIIPKPGIKDQDGEIMIKDEKPGEYPKKENDTYFFSLGNELVTYRPITLHGNEVKTKQQ